MRIGTQRRQQRTTESGGGARRGGGGGQGGGYFPYWELRRVAQRLPQVWAEHQLVIPDFHAGAQVVSEQGVSPFGRRYLQAYGPLMDRFMDLSDTPKRFHTTVRLAAAAAMHDAVRTTFKGEATLAQTQLPVFTRQKLFVIMRAYPRLYSLQLFGFLPMRGPTARMFFKDYQYADNFAGGSPAIAAGDRTDDLTKYNKAYVDAPEGSMANKVTFKMSHLDVSTKDKRVLGEWSEQFEDDARADFDLDAEAEHADEVTRLLQWHLDRTMIDLTVAAVPAANKVTFDAEPAGYAGWTPDQQTAYDQRLYTHGFVDTIEKMRATRRFGLDSTPNWAIIGTSVAKRIRRLKGFSNIDRGAADIDLETGTIRDMGTLTDYGIRLLVDPQFTPAKVLFGRRPVRRNDPAHYLGIYKPLEMTKELYDPNTGYTTKGARCRYAAIVGDAVANPASSQLAEVYGELTVTNA